MRARERERPWGQTTNMQTKESAREIERDERGERREKTEDRCAEATTKCNNESEWRERDKQASERERERVVLRTNNKHANKRERAREMSEEATTKCKQERETKRASVRAREVLRNARNKKQHTSGQTTGS